MGRSQYLLLPAGFDTDAGATTGVVLDFGPDEEHLSTRLGVVEAFFLRAFLAIAIDSLLGDVEDSGGFLHVELLVVLLYDGFFYRFGDRLNDGGFQHFVEEGLKHIVR